MRLGGRHVAPVARSREHPHRARRDHGERDRRGKRRPGVSAWPRRLWLCRRLGLNLCRCARESSYRRDQPVAAARDRFDIPRPPRIVAQGLAQAVNRHRQDIVADVPAVPDAFDQFFLRYWLIRLLREV